MDGLFERIYAVVKTIPEGRVMTYGQVAQKLGLRDVRKVGFALHANKSNKVPCHRVVNREGRLAPNFAFNGAEEQRRRLEAEGVVFLDEMRVDLEKYQIIMEENKDNRGKKEV
jgi:methylated-DNA-protein-cysteine methyltransferase-like protein